MSYLTEEEQHEKEKEERRRLSRQQIIEHVRKSLLFTAFGCAWVPYSAHLLTFGQYPNNQGAISLYELRRGELRTVLEKRVAMPIKCATFGHRFTTSTGEAAGGTGGIPSVRQLATGDFAGSIQFWDIELLASSSSSPCDANTTTTTTNTTSQAPSTMMMITTPPSTFSSPVLEFKAAHASIINSIDGAGYSGGPPEVATGGRDGAVKVWDPRQPTRPVAALMPADAARARDCWAVRLGNSYNASDRTVAAGYDNGDVKLFDLRMNQMIHEFNVSNGVCDIDFDRADIPMNKLIIASLEGRARFYDLRTLHPTLGYAYVEERVSNGTVWAARSLPQNREICMFGGAGELTLCKYVYPPERFLKDPNDANGAAKGVPGTVEELNRVKVGDQPINAMDWNRSRGGLLACTSFDQTVRVMLATKLSLVQ